jgi:hypothetical protein
MLLLRRLLASRVLFVDDVEVAEGDTRRKQHLLRKFRRARTLYDKAIKTQSELTALTFSVSNLLGEGVSNICFPLALC